MNKVWPVISFVLLLIVLDQGWALHRLSEFSELQDRISRDYFDNWVKCEVNLEKKGK